jgi:hypothetical protein
MVKHVISSVYANTVAPAECVMNTVHQIAHVMQSMYKRAMCYFIPAASAESQKLVDDLAVEFRVVRKNKASEAQYKQEAIEKFKARNETIAGQWTDACCHHTCRRCDGSRHRSTARVRHIGRFLSPPKVVLQMPSELFGPLEVGLQAPNFTLEGVLFLHQLTLELVDADSGVRKLPPQREPIQSMKYQPKLL